MSFEYTKWCIFNIVFINNISSSFGYKCIDITFMFLRYLDFSKEYGFLNSGLGSYLDSLESSSAHGYYLCTSSVHRVRMNNGINNAE